MLRKAIIPAAGIGTRMLPATKAVPKELIPVLDKPVIQYVVEEARAAGIRDILIVINKDKPAIRDHFRKKESLELFLEEKNKLETLENIRNINRGLQIEYAFQEEMNGLGDAIRYGRDFVGDEAFAVLLGDTILRSGNSDPVLGQLIEVFEEKQAAVVALEEVPGAIVHRYGVIDGRALTDRLFEINGLIEKPSVDDAPSNLAIASRYILTPDIFTALEKTSRGYNNEIQLTDAMSLLLQKQAIYGWRFEGQRFDVGNKLGFIKTNLLFGLEDPGLKEELKKWIREL